MPANAAQRFAKKGQFKPQAGPRPMNRGERFMSIVRLLTLAMMAAGAAFPLSADAGTLTLLYSFKGGSDGRNPYGGLIYQNGTLYGTTAEGGTFGKGTVFSIDPTLGTKTVLYSFTGSPDGAFPFDGVIYESNALYGTTSSGGASNEGTVFVINLQTGVETVLHSFAGGNDGETPYGGLVYEGGWLYGTTFSGGSSSRGTVFKVAASTGQEVVLASFSVDNGDGPYGGLVGKGRYLYGTTTAGGNSGDGTVFKVNRKTGSVSVIYNFAGGVTGNYPYARLLEQQGSLYGTTVQGDDTGYGNVFKINVKSGAETVLYSFAAGTDAEFPFAGLIYNSGAFYGASYSGGASDNGALFKVNHKTGAETVLYSFAGGAGGANPWGTLVYEGGFFYGTTETGGSSGDGTVFKFTP
jgi:uncharacterized repeat protein (TIGR03803 family)